MTESIALFDMDGTLCDYESAQRNAKSKRNLVKDMKTVEWWANMPRFQLGFDVWDLAGKLGYRRMLLTKGPRRIPNAWTGKKLWVDMQLGRETDLTITHDKSLFYGRILVDDWPSYIRSWLKYRPRGLVIMPANNANKNFTHPQVIRYDGTNFEEVKQAMKKAMKKSLIRVGILGGAFDPPHLGHLKMAEAVIDHGLVDEVWFMPCNRHMFGKSLQSFDIRAELCRSMVENRPNLKVSDYEKVRNLSGSTWELMTSINEEPFAMGIMEFSYIIGLDNAIEIRSWKNHAKLIENVPFIVVGRKGAHEPTYQWYRQEPHQYLKDKTIPQVSSTQIRGLLREGGETEGLLDENVLMTILLDHIYQEDI